MILIKVFTINPQTNKVEVPGTIMDKMPDDELDALDIDYTNPNIWRKIIAKKWPQFIGKYRNKIRWMVYRFGGNPAYVNYFPGYDKNGKQLDLVEYGKV